MFMFIMYNLRLFFGLIAFSVGLVFFINLGNILPNSGSVSGYPLLVTMVVQILTVLLVFGGLILMYLSWEGSLTSNKTTKNGKSH